MTCSLSRAVIAGAALAAFISSAAEADGCRPNLVASLDITLDGAMTTPVSIEGNNRLMAIDTGAALSVVDPQTANDLHLITRRVSQDVMFNTKGEQFKQMAIIHSLKMGQAYATNVRMLVWPSEISSDYSIAGTLGADLLRHYDVDIDFRAGKLNLFTPDQCPGKVYWTNSNVAVVPMRVVNSGHIILPVTVDNHAFDAVLDTGSTHSLLSLETARSAFGLEANSPNMTRVGDISGAVTTAIYRRIFKSLAFGGITITNPTFYMWDSLTKYGMTQAAHIGSRLNHSTESGGLADVTVGLNELRELHIYISYAEQKLYVTPKSATLTAGADLPGSTKSSTAGESH